MRLSRRAEPFDSADFIYELKIDGFRALAHIAGGRGELISSRPDSGIPSLRSRNSRIGQGGKTAFNFPMLRVVVCRKNVSASVPLK